MTDERWNRKIIIIGRHLKKSFSFHREQILPFCHLWYKNSTSPVVSRVTNYQVVGSTNGGLGQDNLLYPHILGCHPPDSVRHLVPESVSLVETECPRSKPSNNLRVFYDKPESGDKQGFAVCSKSLSHLGDVSMRFIEWIELLRALGVDKIFLKILAVHPNVMKVFFYKPWNWPSFTVLFRFLNITSLSEYWRWPG